MSARRWDLSDYRKHRDAHVRRARYASRMVHETQGATRETWREHRRQHVKAARRENWLLVGQSRAISASLFLRKTIGYDQRARAG